MQILPLPDDVDRELLLHLFLAREASASTAIGDGIAIPHVPTPSSSMCRSQPSYSRFLPSR